MFYGTITADGTIDASYAFSNNFSVAQGSTKGTFVVTFNEHMHYSPSIVVTANASGTKQNAVSVEYSMMLPQDLTKPFQAQFTTTKLNASRSYASFSFHARTGQSLAFDASHNAALTLVPQITTFNETQILTLSTKINSLDEHTAQPITSTNPGNGPYTAYLDKGTVLLGVLEDGKNDGTMTLGIQDVVEDPSGNTWTLTGWTFGGNAGPDGKRWTYDGKKYTHALTLGSTSPMTTPESFVITATRGDQTLTSDPVVRLSNVPPAGLSM